MNDHVPDSTGLPLRAMVMMLLFLGVIFLLVGLQTLSSSSSSDDTAATTSASATAAPSPSEEPAAAPAVPVHVYNAEGRPGLGRETADKLIADHFEVTEPANLDRPEGLTETTVFHGTAPGEKETAEKVGEALHAPVETRPESLAELPPGVIVIVTGEG